MKMREKMELFNQLICFSKSLSWRIRSLVFSQAMTDFCLDIESVIKKSSSVNDLLSIHLLKETKQAASPFPDLF
jgi:hypothetical protein